MRVVVRVGPLQIAEIVTVVVEETALVVAVKVTPYSRPGTVTLTGTRTTDGLLLDSMTTAPPTGARFLNVTFPCEVLPPVTDDGVI